MSTEFELFKGTSFSDLMKDIYHNSKKKARQIDGLSDDERERLLREAEKEIESLQKNKDDN